MRIYSDRGIILEDNGLRIGLDCGKGDVNFLSHAHSDHLFSSKKSVIASDETLRLASSRSKKFGERFSSSDFELLDSGHVLGSRSLLYHGSKDVLFTSDFCARSRHFMKAFRPVKADVLIMESTFARPDYVFPDFNKTVREVKREVSRLVGEGRNVLLSGYSLGKAQHLSFIAKGFSNVFVDSRVKEFNDVYREHGVKLPDLPVYGGEKSFVLVSSSKWLPDAVAMSFSGWNVHSSSRLDFVMSDHSDFNELVKTVRKVSPEKVLVHHGFSEDFSKFLKSEGFDASALVNGQHTLSNFF